MPCWTAGRLFTLLREVFAFYEAFRSGTELELPLPRPYRDYIDWLQQQDFSKAEPFWRQTLKGFSAPTPLVVDHLASTGGDEGTRQGDQEVWLSVRDHNNATLAGQGEPTDAQHVRAGCLGPAIEPLQRAR